MSKIRTGFVSNSSSSSFLIYGTILEKRIIENTFKKICKDEYEALFNNHGEDWNDNTYEIIEHICKKLDIPRISYYNPYDDGTHYVGKSWSSIKDAQTGLEFKQEIEIQLKQAFGDDIKCSTYSEAWYG